MIVTDVIDEPSTAEMISVNSSGFDGNLVPTDDTVQKCLEKLDNLIISGGGGPCNIDGGRADENYGSCPTIDEGGA
jgi:hypothetical protein